MQSNLMSQELQKKPTSFSFVIIIINSRKAVDVLTSPERIFCFQDKLFIDYHAGVFYEAEHWLFQWTKLTFPPSSFISWSLFTVQYVIRNHFKNTTNISEYNEINFSKEGFGNIRNYGFLTCSRLDYIFFVLTLDRRI